MLILLISEEEKKGHNNYLIFRSSSHNTFYVYQKGKMENSAEMNLYPPPPQCDGEIAPFRIELTSPDYSYSAMAILLLQ